MRKLGMDRFIPRLAFVLQPNDEQFNSMLAELAGVMGWRGVASVLGISIRTLDSWRKGENGPSAGARKLVWLVWTLVFHPEKLRSLFDVATWGKFVVASNGGVGVLGDGRVRSDAIPSVLSISDKEITDL